MDIQLSVPFVYLASQGDYLTEGEIKLTHEGGCRGLTKITRGLRLQSSLSLSKFFLPSKRIFFRIGLLQIFISTSLLLIN